MKVKQNSQILLEKDKILKKEIRKAITENHRTDFLVGGIEV